MSIGLLILSYDFNGKLVKVNGSKRQEINIQLLDRVDIPNTGMYMFEIKSNDH